jgi:hypothetical protein
MLGEPASLHSEAKAVSVQMLVNPEKVPFSAI